MDRYAFRINNKKDNGSIDLSKIVIYNYYLLSLRRFVSMFFTTKTFHSQKRGCHAMHHGVSGK